MRVAATDALTGVGFVVDEIVGRLASGWPEEYRDPLIRVELLFVSDD